MKPVIRETLRMAVYQLFYMDQVPDSAACNEAVKLVRKRGLKGLSGFVNGVLRSVIRGKDQIKYQYGHIIHRHDKSKCQRHQIFDAGLDH